MYKNEDPKKIEGPGKLHEDVMKISEIGKTNYRKFFLERITGVSTGRIKLRPAFITKDANIEYKKIENQTKDSQEKTYFENKIRKADTRKNELIEIHSELLQKLNLEDETIT